MFEQKNVNGKVSLYCTIDFEPDNIAINTIDYTMPDFLIPFQKLEKDGSFGLIYEMQAGYERLENIPQPLSSGEFLRIFTGIVHTLYDCDDYFLDYRNFCIDSSYIYVSNFDHHVKLIYVPALHNLSEQKTVVKALINIIRSIKILDGTYIKLKFFEMLTEDSSVSDIKNVLSEIKSAETKKEIQTPVASAVVPRKTVEVEIPETPEVRPYIPESDATVLLSETEILSGRTKASPEEDFDTGTALIGFEKWSKNSAFLQCIGNTVGLPEKIEIALVNNAFSIGRTDHKRARSPNDFDFAHIERTKVISRVHARIHFEKGRYYITDQKSSHGTFVNMSKITAGLPVEINNNDMISFSNHGVDYRFVT